MPHGGGTSTVRGITFQHAYAVLRTLQALDVPEVEAFRYEGLQDVVDIELLGSNDQVLVAIQAKTRQEGSTWSSSEISAIFERWESASGQARFEFVTDGQLGPTGIRLREEINSSHRREPDRSIDLDSGGAQRLSPGLLDRLTLATRLPGAEVLLEQARWLLVDTYGSSVSDARRRAAVASDALFRAISLAAGKSEPSDRILGRATVLELVGLDRWRDTAAGLLGEALREVLPPLNERLAPRKELVSRAIEILQGESAKPLVLLGPPGFGKSTLADFVAAQLEIPATVIRWVSATPDIDARSLLSHFVRTGPDTNLHMGASIAELAGQAQRALSDVGLVIVDDLWNRDALQLLASVLPPGARLLVTSGTQEVAEGCKTIHVGALEPAETVDLLRAAAPGAATSDLAALADRIGGWILLAQLVCKGLRRTVRSGLDPNEAVRSHYSTLAMRGPMAFDGGPESDRRRAVKGALAAAFVFLSPVEKEAACRLGVAIRQPAIDVRSLSVLWAKTELETKQIAIALDELGLVRADMATATVHVHQTIRMALEQFVPSGERPAIHADICRRAGAPVPAITPYFAAQLPAHQLLAGNSQGAAKLIGDRAWVQQLEVVSGDAGHVAARAGSIARLATSESAPRPVDVLALALLARIHGRRSILDPVLVPVVGATRGFDVAEAIVRTADSAVARALGHAELAGSYLQTGERARAERNVQLALDAASHYSELVIPDLLIVTVKRLAEASPAWAFACREAIEDVIGAQPEDMRLYCRAVIAHELLSAVPDFAASILRDGIAEIQDAVEETEFGSVFYDYEAEDLLRNALPVIGYFDFDLASLLEEEAGRTGADRSQLNAYGGAAAGHLLAEPADAVSDEAELEHLSNEIGIILSAVERSVVAGRLDALPALCALPGGAVGRVRAWARAGKTAAREMLGEDIVVELFNRSVSLVGQMTSLPLIVDATSHLALEIGAFDAEWSRKVAGSILGLDRAQRCLLSDPDSEARLLVALVANSPPMMVEPAIVDRLASALTASRPSADLLLPEDALDEVIDAVVADGVLSDGLSKVEIAGEADAAIVLRWNGWEAVIEAALDASPVAEVGYALKVILAQPTLGTAASIGGGRLGKLLAQATECGFSELAMQVARRFEGDLQAGLVVETACWLALREGGADDGRAFLDNTSGLRRKLGDKYVRAIRLIEDGDIEQGLRNTRDAVVMWADHRASQASQRLGIVQEIPVPQALRQSMGSVAMSDALALATEIWLGPHGDILCRELLPYCQEIDVERLLEVARKANEAAVPEDLRSLGVSRSGAEVALLADMADRMPNEVMEAVLRAFDGEPDDITDVVAAAACRVLESTGLSRSSVDGFVAAAELWLGKIRLLEAESASVIRLAAQVIARRALPLTPETVAQLLSPWSIGPGLALGSATATRHSDADRCAGVARGIALSGRAGPQEVTFICRMLGEALAKLGYQHWVGTAELEAFERWPGGLAGMLVTTGMLVPEIRVSESAEDCRDLVTLIEPWVREAV